MSWIGPRSVDGGLDRVELASGAIWLCGKHLAAPDPEAALVRADDADAIVCFCEPHELRERYPDYVEWLEANSPSRALWLPIPDLTSPSFAEAQTIVASITERLQNGQELILHCAAGMGRAPTMAICSMVSMGIPADQALADVKAARPGAGPEVGSQAELVKRFETAASGD